MSALQYFEWILLVALGIDVCALIAFWIKDLKDYENVPNGKYIYYYFCGLVLIKKQKWTD